MISGKKKFTFFFILLFNFEVVLASDKTKIIDKLNQTKTIKFKFIQKTDGKEETGSCYILFPGYLKCNYNDSKQKELIINKKNLAITQKRYDKTYYYPVSKSPFLKILNKVELINLIKNSKLSIQNNRIVLSNLGSSNQLIKVFFDNERNELVGWEIIDQFGKKINFSINIINTNESLNKAFFDIPKIN